MWCKYNVKYVSDWRCNVNVRQADKQTQVCRNMHSVHSFTANVDLSHTLYISTSTFAQNYIRAADLQPLFTLYNLLLSANSLLNISLLWSKQKRGFWLNCIGILFLFQGFRFCDFWVRRNCGQSVRDSFSRDQQQNGEFNIFVSSSTLSANVY